MWLSDWMTACLMTAAETLKIIKGQLADWKYDFLGFDFYSKSLKNSHLGKIF